MEPTTPIYNAGEAFSRNVSELKPGTELADVVLNFELPYGSLLLMVVPVCPCDNDKCKYPDVNVILQFQFVSMKERKAITYRINHATSGAEEIQLLAPYVENMLIEHAGKEHAKAIKSNHTNLPQDIGVACFDVMKLFGKLEGSAIQRDMQPGLFQEKGKATPVFDFLSN